jgi:hypothetical protein
MSPLRLIQPSYSVLRLISKNSYSIILLNYIKTSLMEPKAKPACRQAGLPAGRQAIISYYMDV